MVLYKCICGLETNHKGHLRDHLNRKTPCTPNMDMSTININSLAIGNKKMINSDYSGLTEEEKNKKYNKDKKIILQI